VREDRIVRNETLCCELNMTIEKLEGERELVLERDPRRR
jgi:hypothetical protein